MLWFHATPLLSMIAQVMGHHAPEGILLLKTPQVYFSYGIILLGWYDTILSCEGLEGSDFDHFSHPDPFFKGKSDQLLCLFTPIL
jgi:hypothetical protein